MKQNIWNLVGHAVVNSKGTRRFRAGHPWIYASDIVERPRADAGLVSVAGPNKRVLGHAFFSPASTITLRFVTQDDVPFTHELLKQRLQAAQQRRQRLLGDADAWRLVHGEADFLPGIFIDRYDDCLALQTTCAAAALFESCLVDELEALLKPRAIVLRNDSATRARERLPREVTIARGSAPVTASYHEGDVEIAVDLLGEQKTGSFLDQAHNHVGAARYGTGVALDCFTYHGGFALQLASRCEHVTAYDISDSALERARANARRANAANVEFVRADVLEKLPALLRDGARYDTIVLDPPAFASGKHTVEAAGRAYKEINLRAMRLLRPNSILITCSCSGRITPSDFDAIVEAAARDAGRALHVVERWSAGPDHPVLVGVPETDYLKCRVLMVL